MVTKYMVYEYHFYSRPCGRGDSGRSFVGSGWIHFYSRPCGRGDEGTMANNGAISKFLLTPLREGRQILHCGHARGGQNFYSRPCGRGDCLEMTASRRRSRFLLTPLREGRLPLIVFEPFVAVFLLTPLREGRRVWPFADPQLGNFYSRPCGRGDFRTMSDAGIR